MQSATHRSSFPAHPLPEERLTLATHLIGTWRPDMFAMLEVGVLQRHSHDSRRNVACDSHGLRTPCISGRIELPRGVGPR